MIFYKNFFRGIIARAMFALLLSTPAVWANALQSPLQLSDFPGAQVIHAEQKNTDDYVLALSNYRKIRDRWEFDDRHLSGKLTRKTYRLPKNHSAQEAFNFFREQLDRYPLRELYTCRSRDCGESNSWANQHFNVLQLYGKDKYQYYGVYEITDPKYAGIYVTLYSVLRGNDRVYAQLEVLVSDQHKRNQLAGNPATLLHQLKRDGFVVFPGLRADKAKTQLHLVPEHVQVLAKALREDADIKVALVGHNYQPIQLAEARQRSLGYAKLLQAALVASGVDKKRLSIFGLGGLAPAGRGDSDIRLDVVLLH